MNWGIAGSVLGIVACVAVGLSADAASMTPAQIADQATPSIVLIKVPNGLGSGFVVSADGRIVTNMHVIRDAKEATIVTADGKEYTNIAVLALDVAHDVVLLRAVGATGLKPLSLGDSTTARPGQHVVAIGHPLGLGNTVSDGLVSAVRELPNKLTLLQISAPISPGSSGGPVMDDQGSVIGISTLVVSGGQNLNFVVPINVVRPLLASTTSTPLASLALPTRRRRNIPRHPPDFLASCPAPQFVTVLSGIQQAIDVGAPLYNQGNVEACYRIYASAAISLQSKIEDCPGPKRALLDGIDNADKSKDWDDKAWAMRDAFDGIVAVALGNNGGTAEADHASSARQVPHLPDTVFDDCDQAGVDGIRDSIASAVHSGAPLFNSGNVEACYRIYEGAVSEVDRKITGCRAAKRVLHDGLSVAETRTGWAPKAWAIRDAFDGISNAIDKRSPARN